MQAQAPMAAAAALAAPPAAAVVIPVPVPVSVPAAPVATVAGVTTAAGGSTAAPAPAPEPEKSAEMKALLQHEAQIKEWSGKVNKRIFELEEQYLEATTLGNIVRGWDQDAKPTQQRKVLVDDKERIFSNSNVTSVGPGSASSRPRTYQAQGQAVKAEPKKKR